MLSITHTIISLPLAFLFTNPILIFVSALLLHLFADTLLHWNIYPEQFKRFPILLIALDVAGGPVVALSLLGNEALSLPVLLAIFGGNLPDVLHMSWGLLPPRIRDNPPNWIAAALKFHDHIQHETHIKWHGLILQVLVMIIAISLLFRLV